MLTISRTGLRRVPWSVLTSTALELTLVRSLQRDEVATFRFRCAQTPPGIITALRDYGLSLGDLGCLLGVGRGRIWEWQRGVHGMSHPKWARLTVLRDVVDALLSRGVIDIRSWLFAYCPELGMCPSEAIALDEFAAVMRAAGQS